MDGPTIILLCILFVGMFAAICLFLTAVTAQRNMRRAEDERDKWQELHRDEVVRRRESEQAYRGLTMQMFGEGITATEALATSWPSTAPNDKLPVPQVAYNESTLQAWRDDQAAASAPVEVQPGPVTQLNELVEEPWTSYLPPVYPGGLSQEEVEASANMHDKFHVSWTEIAAALDRTETQVKDAVALMRATV